MEEIYVHYSCEITRISVADLHDIWLCRSVFMLCVRAEWKLPIR